MEAGDQLVAAIPSHFIPSQVVLEHCLAWFTWLRLI
jgi:hypothetical protein